MPTVCHASGNPGPGRDWRSGAQTPARPAARRVAPQAGSPPRGPSRRPAPRPGCVFTHELRGSGGRGGTCGARGGARGSTEQAPGSPAGTGCGRGRPSRGPAGERSACSFQGATARQKSVPADAQAANHRCPGAGAPGRPKCFRELGALGMVSASERGDAPRFFLSLTEPPLLTSQLFLGFRR